MLIRKPITSIKITEVHGMCFSGFCDLRTQSSFYLQSGCPSLCMHIRVLIFHMIKGYKACGMFRDNKGIGVAHKITSSENQPQFFRRQQGWREAQVTIAASKGGACYPINQIKICIFFLFGAFCCTLLCIVPPRLSTIRLLLLKKLTLTRKSHRTTMNSNQTVMETSKIKCGDKSGRYSIFEQQMMVN